MFFGYKPGDNNNDLDIHFFLNLRVLFCFVYNKLMIPELIRRSFGIITFVLSLIIFIWGIIPSPKQVKELTISADEMHFTQLMEVNQEKGNLEIGLTEIQELQSKSLYSNLNLQFPRKIRVGDTAFIRLSLDMPPQKSSESSSERQPSENEIVLIQQVFDKYHVIIETRLELAGFDYLPIGEISEALLPWKAVAFNWNIRPGDQGFYRGTIWMHIKFLPKNGGDEIRQLLTAQTVEIESIDLLGLDGTIARILGSIGLVIGVLLNLEFFLRKKSRG
jgi:hypothetical protein